MKEARGGRGGGGGLGKGGTGARETVTKSTLDKTYKQAVKLRRKL